MAHMDIIEAARNAYRTTWQERAYLLRLAAIPFFLKIVCFTMAARFADDGTYMRFILIMLPSLLAEGWMLSHYTRLIALGHRWPFRPSGDMDADLGMLRVRARGVLSGLIVFALINMAVGFLVATAGDYFPRFLPENPADKNVEIPAHVAFLSLALLVFVFWGFRLAWLHIAYALNLAPAAYLRALRGIGSSLHMIGVWLLCFLPCYLLLGVFAGGIAPMLEGLIGKSAATFATLLVSVLADTLKTIVATAGITYALLPVFAANKMGPH